MMIMEMLTGDEVQTAVVKAALQKQGVKASDVEAFIKDKEVAVSYRSVKFPDGSSQLLAAVGVAQKEAPPPVVDPGATRRPVEKADG